MLESKRIYQVNYKRPNQILPDNSGDCFTACLATLLNKNYHTIPNFVLMSTNNSANFWYNVKTYLNKNNYKIDFYSSRTLIKSWSFYYIVLMKYKDSYGHSVIAREDRLIHDPLPLNKFLDINYFISSGHKIEALAIINRC